MLEKYQIKKKVEAHIKECEAGNLYTLFESEYAQKVFSKKLDYDSLSYFYELMKNWDDALAVPKPIGKYLEQLVSDQNLTIGIHRTEIDSELTNNETMHSILENGLRNYGDLSSGSVRDKPDLGKTISFTPNILNALILLKSSYKNSTGGFILSFPKSLVDNEGTVTEYNVDFLYHNVDGVNHIRPEYIVGYIDNSYGVMNFYSREDLLNQYNQKK